MPHTTEYPPGSSTSQPMLINIETLGETKNQIGLESWIQEAKRQQDEWYNVFRDREILENCVQSETNITFAFDKDKHVLLLKKVIGYAMFGPPSSLPSYESEFTGYKRDQLDCIEQILSTILSINDEKCLVMSYILLVCKPKDDSSDTCQEIVLRIHENGNHSSSVFVDNHSRIYRTWTDFKENNLLPKCVYCCPKDGDYETTLTLEYLLTPACSFTHAAVNALDSIATVASVATLGAVAAGSVVTLAPAVLTATAVSTIGTGAYLFTRNLYSLFDRKTHGQSISVANPEARQSWLSIGTSVVAGTTGAFVSRVQRVASSGGEISKTAVRTMRTLATANVMVSGISTLDSVFYCKQLYDNNTLKPLDVFNLSCEFLFFFNATSTLKTTNKLISIMENTRVTPNSTKKTTKSMKRRLRRRRAVMKQELQSTLHESNFSYSAITKQMLSTALSSAIAGTRAESLQYIVYNLGHDLRSVHEQQTDLPTFLINSYRNVKDLYTNFQNEIDTAFSELYNWFDNKENYYTTVKHLLTSASQTAESYFKCIVLWVKLKFEKCMEYLHEIIGKFCKKKNESNEEIDEANDSYFDSSEGLEPHEKVMVKISELTEQHNLTFDSLKEYADTYDFACSNILQSFQEKLLDYEKHCELVAKMDLENGIDVYNKLLGMNGDPEDHFLKELINKHLTKPMIAKMKNLCLQKSRTLSKNFDFWLNVDDKIMFYYYVDEQGNGHSPSEIKVLDIIYKITDKHITVECIKFKENEDRDVVIILPEKYDMWFKGIFISCALNNDNANIYLIMII